jgi:hypothetical protein
MGRARRSFRTEQGKTFGALLFREARKIPSQGNARPGGVFKFTRSCWLSIGIVCVDGSDIAD